MEQTRTVSQGHYRRLLGSGGFEAFLWTQFLGAFNDNVYKMMVSMLAVEIAANQLLGARYLAIANAVFVLPYLLFAGYAGQLADRFSKTRVLQVTKSLEIVTMLLGLTALLTNRIELLLVVLFLLAVQANFFSPAKYGILPEMMSEAELSAANGLVEFTTLAAIVFGTSFGSFLIAIWKHDPWKLGGTLLAIAVVGTLCSLRITRVRASGATQPFHWNPFAEVHAGFKELRRNRALSLTIAGLSYFWFLGAVFYMAVLLMGKETLHTTEMESGLLATALAMGIGAGSIAAGWISRNHIELGLVPVGSFLLGFFSICLGFARSYELAMALLLLAGFSGGLYFIPLNAFLQERAGTQEKGRMLAINNFVNTAGMLLSSAVLWVLHDRLHWSAASIIGAMGALTVLVTLYVLRVLAANGLRLFLLALTRFVFRIRIVGAEHIPASGSALIVSNHVSFADAALIGCCTHRFVRFLMWKPYFELKFARPFFRALEAIPINPGSPKEMLRSLRQAADELNRGELVCIFPEGALTRTGHVQAFQRGVERLMEKAPEAVVIPIYLDGLWKHPLSAVGRKSIREWMRTWKARITVVIGEPISGPVPAHDLQQRVIELGTEAFELRKTQKDTLAHRLVRSARSNWSRPAIADSTGKRLTFGKTLTAATLFRNWLNARRPGEKHVGLMLPNSAGGAIANFGVTLAGRAAVNLNFTAGEQACRAAIATCGIRTVLTSKLFIAKAGLPIWPEMIYVEDLVRGFSRAAKLRAFISARFGSVRRLTGHISPDDTATVLFSSGSTGVPKGVELTHWNIVSNIDATSAVFPVSSADCMLSVLPFFHSFGYTYALWFPAAREFRAVFHTNPTDAKMVGELAQQHGATFLLATPTFCSHYTRKCSREQFGSLRYVLVGAERLRDAAAEEFRNKFGIDLLAGYGATELGPAAAVNTPNVNGQGSQCGTRAGSVGRPLPGTSMRVINAETFAPLPPGEQGMLLVKSPSRMQGYYGEPQKTRGVLHDGFYITGDLARIDEDGFVFITDRLARFSKIGGEMVPHLKIEEVASEVLTDAGCFVTGVSDEKRGERLVLLYTSTNIEAAEILNHLQAANLPPLWIPKRDNIYFVDSIPVLGTGKVDLAGARALAATRVTEKLDPVSSPHRAVGA